MGTRWSKRWLRAAWVMLGLLACAVVAGKLGAQEPLRWSRNDPGDARPILVNADDIATWQDQGKRIFLLKGNVYFEQGDARVRLPQAVLWADEDLKKRVGLYQLDFYGDGGVTLEVQANSYEGPWGLFQLNTRGEIKLKSFKSKVQSRAMPEDPLYQRALAARSGKPPAPAPPPSPPPSKQATPPPAPPDSKPATARYDPILQTGAQEPVSTIPAALPPAAAPTTVTALPAASTAQVTQPPVVVPPPGPAGPPGSFGPPVSPVNPLPPVNPGPPGAVVPVPPVPPSVGGPVAPPRPPGEAAPPAPPRQLSIRPRSSVPFKIKEFPMENGEKAVVLSPGIILHVAPTDPSNKDMVDIEADRVVIWTRGDTRELVDSAKSGQGHQARNLEVYLAGNVEIRNLLVKVVNNVPVVEQRTLRCSEAYYDINRDVAIALDADLEMKQPTVSDPVHVIGKELNKLNTKLYQFGPVGVNASKTPYGPGLEVDVQEGTLEEKRIPKKTIFGFQVYKRETGEPEFEDQTIFRGTNVVMRLEGVPVLYFPFLQGDVRDPLGPLQSASVGYNRAFGAQFFTSWNMYDLVGIDPLPDSHWRLNADYLTSRGPALGMDFGARGKDFLGIPSRYDINVEARGIYDTGTDLLGGDRGEVVVFGNRDTPQIPSHIEQVVHPTWRGRLLAQLNWQDLPEGFSVQGQFAAISDRNYLDQYANQLWVNGLNQETFLYVKQQQNNWAWTVLGEPNLRNWITETEWLPQVNGYWLGQDLLDMFTYTAKTSVGYGILQPTHQPPPPFESTDFAANDGRFDLYQKLALPFTAGAFRLVPYGILDLTYYTQDINGSDEARLYGGGGIQGSIPFSRLYPDVESELLNLHGIYHKIVLSGNYFWAHSDVSHLLLPQMDRLNDDATDQAMRDIYPVQVNVNPANAAMLTSGFFDPQFLALRKLVDDRIDTRDSMEEVQLDLRQRWQTKRGFPGQEHIVDWMTLDVGATFFPQPNRDNFGEVVNFIEYDWTWNVGDRTSLFSSGWFDPHEGGARVFNIGAQFNRPDRSSLLLNYRQIDPLDSKAVVAAVTVPFSAKYSLTASTSYDFGVNTQINSLAITRYGTDLQISLGFTYNSILNSFGFLLEIYPNLLPANRRLPPGGGLLPMTQGH
jgi:hypothetical protein